MNDRESRIVTAAILWSEALFERPYDTAPKARRLYDAVTAYVDNDDEDQTDIDLVVHSAEAFIAHQKSKPEPQSLAWSPADTKLYEAVIS